MAGLMQVSGYLSAPRVVPHPGTVYRFRYHHPVMHPLIQLYLFSVQLLYAVQLYIQIPFNVRWDCFELIETMDEARRPYEGLPPFCPASARPCTDPPYEREWAGRNDSRPSYRTTS